MWHKFWLITKKKRYYDPKVYIDPRNILHVIFMLFWMKYTLIWFSLWRNGTENGLSNSKDTFAESFQLQISVLHYTWRYTCLKILLQIMGFSFDLWILLLLTLRSVTQIKKTPPWYWSSAFSTFSSLLKFWLFPSKLWPWNQ